MATHDIFEKRLPPPAARALAALPSSSDEGLTSLEVDGERHGYALDAKALRDTTHLKLAKDGAYGIDTSAQRGPLGPFELDQIQETSHPLRDFRLRLSPRLWWSDRIGCTSEAVQASNAVSVVFRNSELPGTSQSFWSLRGYSQSCRGR